MQQRRLRLGDVLDDYCPRERRITNHAVVAMIDDTVKQTRCTTCDAEHEYKEARVPAARRRKTGTPAAQLVDSASRAAADVDESHEDASPMVDDVPEAAEIIPTEAETQAEHVAAPVADQATEGEALEDANAEQDEWPVHRPLIRATLPRPEGHTPERKAPDFTFRPAGGRFDSRNGQRQRGGHRQARNTQGQSPSGQSRFGGQRGPGHGGGPQGQRQGNRSGQGGGAGRPGQGRGPRPGGGRKRGR